MMKPGESTVFDLLLGNLKICCKEMVDDVSEELKRQDDPQGRGP
jgi:hypothetical protein